MRQQFSWPTKPSERFIGFGPFFDEILKDMNRLDNVQNYPPYDLIHIDDNNTELRFAVAGFNKDELSIEIDNNVLIISGSPTKSITTENELNDPNGDSKYYLKKGIATRGFEQRFRISYTTTIGTPSLKDGILSIVMNTQKENNTKKKLEIL